MSLIQQLEEARYYKEDEKWYTHALTTAEGNVASAKARRGPFSRQSDQYRHEMMIYYQDYADWLADNKKELDKLYQAFKQDRNMYLDHLANAGMDRVEYAETWGGTIEPSDYPEYSEFRRRVLPNDPRPEHAQEDYLEYVTSSMIDVLQSPHTLREAKYASGDNTEWQEILDIVKHYSGDLNEFVKNNEKILKELFKTVKGSFRMFHDMTHFYIEDNPEDYNEEDKDPQKIAAYWWDMFPQDLDEEPLWQQATTKFGGPLFGDVIQIFGEYITQNAERIAQFDQIYEAQYIKQDIKKRLPVYWKWGDERSSPEAHRVLKNPKVKHKGSGAFASTYQHQDRPHDVTKITKPMENPDGYQQYLRELLRHEDRDNPYFPKIRDVRERRREKANIMAIRMESLRHLEEISKEELQALLAQWFGKNTKHVLSKLYPRTPMPPNTWDVDGLGLPHAVVVNTLEAIFANDYYHQFIVDNNLLNAVNWINYIVRNNSFDLDLGQNNIMMRRTPYGVQIVFTDPVA